MVKIVKQIRGKKNTFEVCWVFGFFACFLFLQIIPLILGSSEIPEVSSALRNAIANLDLEQPFKVLTPAAAGSGKAGKVR